MKKLVSFLIAIMLLTATAGAVDLYVDMEKIATDTPPTIVEGRTLVPLRAIFEAIGAAVEWDQSTYTATGVKGDTTVVVQLNNTIAYVNGEARTLDVPAQLINNRTMVPARFISESMGCDVTWYQATQTAAVANKTKGQHIYVTETGDKYHYSGTCNGGTYYEATLAEAMGRGLTPCDKCVLVISSNAPSNAPASSSEIPSWLNPSSGTDSSFSDAPVTNQAPSAPIMPEPVEQPSAPVVPQTPNQSVPQPSGSSGSGNADNFNTYDNANQQKTEARYVLNTSSKKIHFPSCSQVKKIAPHNYATSSLSEAELKAQGYTTCGVCHK